MPLDAGAFAALVLLGGLVGIDGTSVGQFMLSRPVVAATLAGLVVGDPASGAMVGLILEALNLTILPVGAARYPEIGPASVVAGGVVAAGAGGAAWTLTAVLFAMSWAWLSGLAVRQMRQANIRLMMAPASPGGEVAALERRHLWAIALDLVRSATLTAAALLLLVLVLRITESAWGLGERLPHLVLWSLAAAGIAATLRLFGERRGVLFAIGVACGTLVVALR